MVAEGQKLQLHLRDTTLSALDASLSEDSLHPTLQKELREAFLRLEQQMLRSGADPFHLRFWQACEYGPNFAFQPPTLEIVFDS